MTTRKRPTIEERPVFLIAETKKEGPILMIGFTEGCMKWLLEKKMTHNMDLSSFGLPLKMMFFGERTHDDCMKKIQEVARQEDVPLIDMRREDVTIDTLKDKE